MTVASAAGAGARCLKVFVASANPVKVNSVKSALSKCFPSHQFTITGVPVDSGVPDQPFGDVETLAGARNRVKNLSVLHPSSLCVALEGGVGHDMDNRTLECFAWAVVLNAKTGAEGKARSASFELPPSVCKLVQGGMELGDADDKVFGRFKSGSGSGTVGHLTSNLITRTNYYDHAVSLALIPFMNPEHYPGCGIADDSA